MSKLKKFKKIFGEKPKISQKVIILKDEEKHFSGLGKLRILKIKYSVPEYISNGKYGYAWIVYPEHHNGKYAIALHQSALKYDLGKSEVFGDIFSKKFGEDQIYGLELVKQGYVVIAPDALCFEDRSMFGFLAKNMELNRKNPWEANVSERIAHEYELLRGRSYAWRLFVDDSSAIDALQSIEGRKITNIVSIGHSLGGLRSLFLTLLDYRVKLGVSNSGFSSVDIYNSLGLVQNYGMIIPYMIKEGLDYQQLIKFIPKNKKFIIIAGKKDEWNPWKATKPIIDNVPKNVETFVHEKGHVFSKYLREKSYQFLSSI